MEREISSKQNINSLLDDLERRKAHSEIVYNLLDKGFDVSERHIDTALEYCKEGEIIKGEMIASKAGRPEEEVDFHLMEAERFDSETQKVKGISLAASVAEKKGLEERSKELYKEATERARNLEERSLAEDIIAWGSSAGIEEEVKEWMKEDIEKFREGKEYSKAITYARELDAVELVIELREEAGHSDAAGEIAREEGFPDRALRNYQNYLDELGEYEDVREVLEEAYDKGLVDKSLEGFDNLTVVEDLGKAYGIGMGMARQFDYGDKFTELGRKAMIDYENRLKFDEAIRVAESIGLDEKVENYRALKSLLDE